MQDSNRARPEAAAAIWAGLGSEVTEADPPGSARLRGVLQALGGGAVAGLLFWLWSEAIGTVVATISLVIGLSALLSPHGLYAAIERGLAALGQLTGRWLSWILLGFVFYALVTPFGLLFRRGKRDAMRRRYEPELDSYWEPRELGRSGSDSHTRQF